MRGLLDEALADSETSLVSIYTFHSAVFQIQDRLDAESRARVRVHSFKELYHTQGSIPYSGALPTSPVDMGEALAVLRSVLEAVSAFDVTRAVRKSDLRTPLAHLNDNNPLFKKGTSGTQATGLISAVVREALQKGLIKLEAEMDATNPYIWLAAADRRSGPAVSAAEGVPNGPRRSRSQEFLDILKEQNLGPFAKLRPMLSEAMQQGLVSGPIPIGTLIDRALVSAKDTVIAEIHRSDSFPWRKVREFLMLLLSRRPVLTMQDGSVVALIFGNLSNEVTALQPNWKLELDGELVLGIVKGTSISLHDVSSMTGALLLDRGEKNVEYIFRVVKHLLEKGRLAEVHDDHSMHLIATGVVRNGVVAQATLKPTI